MDLIFVSPIRLFCDGLAACLSQNTEISRLDPVPDLSHLRLALAAAVPDVVLIDITQGVDLEEVRVLVSEFTSIAFVALGLQEQREEVIRCGRAGFCGYVPRTSSIDELCRALTDAVTGRLACSAEISGGLLRALFRLDSSAHPSHGHDGLTRREGDVLKLIGRGLSNKEIARELSLSLATVKHHVHNVLEKLDVPRRAQAMRRVRDTPWIVTS